MLEVSPLFAQLMMHLTVKVLENTSEQYKIKFNFTNNDLGGDRYLNTGELVTEKDIKQFKNSDAILLGAIGHPDVKPGILEQGILLKLRKEFPFGFVGVWRR